MSRPVIPDEAVETAAKVLAESIGNAVDIWEMHSWATQDRYRKHARGFLEAAAPYMMAHAWQEGCEEGLSWKPGYDEKAFAQNPYAK